MADEIQASLGVKPELIPGAGGIFDIKVDGKLVFSKFTTGRFPEPGEVPKLIEA